MCAAFPLYHSPVHVSVGAVMVPVLQLYSVVPELELVYPEAQATLQVLLDARVPERVQPELLPLTMLEPKDEGIVQELAANRRQGEI